MKKLQNALDNHIEQCIVELTAANHLLTSDRQFNDEVVSLFGSLEVRKELLQNIT